MTRGNRPWVCKAGPPQTQRQVQAEPCGGVCGGGQKTGRPGEGAGRQPGEGQLWIGTTPTFTPALPAVDTLLSVKAPCPER